MTTTILDEIIAWKRQENAKREQACPIQALKAQAAGALPPRDFAAALRPAQVGDTRIALIAEIKRASPSKGLIRPDLDPVALSGLYQANGAAAISVLTDEHFFQGTLNDLQAVRRTVTIPVLRKDFIIHPYQVYEARAAGADAVLLIVAALTDGELAALYDLVCDLGLSALVEVHNEAECRRAVKIEPRIIGVNNRDLQTFTVDLETTARLRPLIPADVILVAESGIHTAADVARLAQIGVDAMLVGESLVRAQDVGRQVRELIGRQA
ncbi:MAG: indole-3-glycerol phosphate synthase TrpC [Anaerolineae bacterium]|nr:indole-3-glycerol phosphate synthase TrpC [Anaerolineae bacterium]